jgi:peptidoglycan/LPS O-acetylase OafA/YrhL
MALKYRPEIDGLRAVAVLPVMLFHAGVSGFEGGFIGVDIFFVISGFLITSIIRREQEQGRFSLARFYERRARRILPALFVVLLTCLPFAWMWLLPEDLSSFGASLWSVMLFGSNLHFYSESGYFNAAAELKPLLHTWSLAVEEQFYLLFPLLLGLLARRERWMKPVIGLLVVGGFYASFSFTTQNPALAFFGAHARAWQLMIGALCALIPLQRKAWRWSTLAGLVGLLSSLALTDSNTAWPGSAALLPTLSTALLCWASRPGQPGFALLSHRYLVTLGLMSYSAYLWHQPLLAFARHRAMGEPNPALLSALLLLSLGLAYLSWRWIEAPFRRPKTVPLRWLYSASAGCALLLGIAGVAAQESAGFPNRMGPEAQALHSQALQRNPLRADCHLDAKNLALKPLPNWERCGLKALDRPALPNKALLLGDSHADALAPALQKRAASLGLDLAQLSASACPPVPGLQAKADPKAACPAFNEHLFTWLEGDEAPKIIVLSARWSLYLHGARFDNGHGGRELGKPYPMRSETGVSTAELYQMAVLRLLKAGKQVLLILPIPEAGWDVPKAATKLLLRGENLQRLANPVATIEVRDAAAKQAFLALEKHKDLMFIDPAKALCAKDCALMKGSISLYYDDDHPSLAGANLIAELWTKVPASAPADSPPTRE